MGAKFGDLGERGENRVRTLTQGDVDHPTWVRVFPQVKLINFHLMRTFKLSHFISKSSVIKSKLVTEGGQSVDSDVIHISPLSLLRKAKQISASHFALKIFLQSASS